MPASIAWTLIVFTKPKMPLHAPASICGAMTLWSRFEMVIDTLAGSIPVALQTSGNSSRAAS